MNEFMWEYGIFREGDVGITGEPRLNRIVNVSFHTLEEVQNAVKNVPSLKDRPVIIARRKITAWEIIE